MIPIAQPLIGKEEIEAVVGVLKSGILTTKHGDGPYSKKFEENFAKYIGVKYAVTMSSGTAALHAALLAADIGADDEVIIPSFTFVATAEAVVLAGAKPCFVDIDPKTYCIDPDAIEEAITSRTAAIIPVHMYGLMADMEKIMKIARQHDLVVIEDAAQAIGAELNGKKAGSFGDFGCFSFYASKNITTGEGGMVTTNRRDNAEILYALRSHGIGRHHSSERLGHNYRMSELACAIGYYQLLKLPRFLEARRRNASILTSLLEEVSRLELPFQPEGYKHAWHLYTVRLKGCRAGERNKVVNKLVNAGIQAEVYYATPVHMAPFYRRKFGFRPRSLPKTEAAARQVFSLPSHPGLTEEDLKYIGQKVKKIVG
ncbi:aminotransferase DegT [Candidatus Bathyarchaeota archaeon]|nr:MAG: aminotransferase DegT [Candidatus Bathyarchaeota archaeon]